MDDGQPKSDGQVGEATASDARPAPVPFFGPPMQPDGRTRPAPARHHQALRPAAGQRRHLAGRCDRGEVLALLGENGAGKTHAGVDPVRPLRRRRRRPSRSIGRPLPPGQPRAALAAGIGMVHQHFTLADNLSVLDNVMLGTEAAVAAVLAPRRRARRLAADRPRASAWRSTRMRASATCRWASASGWRSSRRCTAARAC